MSNSPLPEAPYSAAVTLSLVAGNQTFPLSEIGSNGFTLREPSQLPAGDAEVVMTVDGREYRWSVALPTEFAPPNLTKRVRVALRDGRAIPPTDETRGTP